MGEGLGQVVTGAQGTGAVSIRMGTAEVAWMRRQTSKPSRGGIRTSSTTTSGPSSAKCRGAVPPSAATSARQVRPDQARREGDYQAMSRSSSAISTVSGMVSLRWPLRYHAIRPSPAARRLTIQVRPP